MSNTQFCITCKDDRPSLLLVNVDLLTNNRETREEQAVYLGRLASLIDNALEQKNCVLGDNSSSAGIAFCSDVQQRCEE